MPLREYDFAIEYRTGTDDLVGDFYRPALSRATRYWRAAGFFASTSFETIGAPMGEFFYRGGTVRLITSVRLSHEDVSAIQAGIDGRQICEDRILSQIREDFRRAMGKGTALLVALLAIGRLELRICVPNGELGIYHEKVGVFLEQSDEEYVSFAGSSNETRSGLEVNYEAIDVYSSWSESRRAKAKRLHFERLWAGTAPGVTTYSFPEAAQRQLIQIAQEVHPELFSTHASLPKEDNRWRHQREALDLFLVARRGILEMATGTGKTRTALNIFQRLFRQHSVNSLIVTAEGVDLLHQWYENILPLAAELPSRIRILRHFGAYHDRQEFMLSPVHSVLVISRSRLDAVLRRLNEAQLSQTLIVHDEVHGLGSQSNVDSLDGLSESVVYRLGLSATPEREYDASGTAFIERNVGPVLFRFGLEEAIKRGILCEFDYFPLEYSLTVQDKIDLQAVHRRAAARAAEGLPMSQEEIWTALARVAKRSPAKLPLFRTFLETHPDILERCIIFVEDRDYGERVLEIVHAFQHNFHTYYAADNRQTLDEFAKGDIDCLITCERLSEGIDIRSVRSIVLFSSDRARLQTTQRIGRCLRIDPNQPAKRASVVDFILRQDPDKPELNADQSRAVWLAGLSEGYRWRCKCRLSQ